MDVFTSIVAHSFGGVGGLENVVFDVALLLLLLLLVVGANGLEVETSNA